MRFNIENKKSQLFKRKTTAISSYKFVFVFVFLPFFTFSQPIVEGIESYAKIERKGASISLEFPKKEVVKSYWTYSKAKGVTQYVRDHYQTSYTMLSQKILLFGKIVEEENKSVLHIAMEEATLPDSVILYVKNQIPLILRDFSVYIQKKNLEELIRVKENRAVKIGSSIEKLKKSGKKEAEQARLFIELNALIEEIDRLRTRLVLLLNS